MSTRVRGVEIQSLVQYWIRSICCRSKDHFIGPPLYPPVRYPDKSGGTLPPPTPPGCAALVWRQHQVAAYYISYWLILLYILRLGQNGENVSIVYHISELSWRYCITVAPRNLQIKPRQSTYEPGDRIQCSAKGNPEPSYQWTDLVSGTVIQGDFLVISEDMVNSSYVFRCTASNYFNRTIHNESTTLHFTVPPAPSIESSTGYKQKFHIMSRISHFRPNGKTGIARTI